MVSLASTVILNGGWDGKDLSSKFYQLKIKKEEMVWEELDIEMKEARGGHTSLLLPNDFECA